MEKIDKSNPKYADIVDDYNKNEYDIDSNKMLPEQQIICPHDTDMLIQKNADGTVSVIKKSFSKNVFSK